MSDCTDRSDRNVVKNSTNESLDSELLQYTTLSTSELLEKFEAAAFCVFCLSYGSYEAMVYTTIGYILEGRGCGEELIRIIERVKTEGRKLVESWEREDRENGRHTRKV